jgi:hypothetical protein
MGIELENRLNELFGDEDTHNASAPDASKEGKPQKENPLAELKNQVLSLDWEISDDVLDNFMRQVENTQKRFSSDKIILTFLQILGSLGSYIRTKRGQAHAKTFKTLNAVFNGLDQVANSPRLSETEKKRRLQLEIKRYNDLKSIIAKSKRPAPPAKPPPAEPTEPEMNKIAEAARAETSTVPPRSEGEAVPADDGSGETLTADALAAAVSELKQFIRSEISKLKKEIEALSKG